MQLVDLLNKSMLIVGFGVEGLSTYEVLRKMFPQHLIGIADQRSADSLPGEVIDLLRSDQSTRLHFGSDYLANLSQYDVVIKSPGISPHLPEIQRAIESGKLLTSQTELFFANGQQKVIGVTGTKGKGTTSKLIYSILKNAGWAVQLVGNIGTPALPVLLKTKRGATYVFELSAQQLENLKYSPHIAVLLNIVPDHLDHFVTFENYLAAKQNITSHQTENDYLVYNTEFATPRKIAKESKAQRIPYSVTNGSEGMCGVEQDYVFIRDDKGDKEFLISLADVEEVLPGLFNLHNILPAITVARLLRIDSHHIVQGIKTFTPQEHRFEMVGTYRGITFYNASIATVPEVTIEHLRSLEGRVQTALLGGFDRGLDFTGLGKYLVESQIRNLILFPRTGERIWEAVTNAVNQSPSAQMPKAFFIDESTGEEAMSKAVALAYQHTEAGQVCLHSPASPSFGLFRDYKERGTLFKRFVVRQGSSSPKIDGED